MRAAVLIARRFTSSSIANRFSRVWLTALCLMGASVSLFAQVAVSPASLTFASQAIGSTSAAKVVTVTNQGSAAQTVVFAASASFSETDKCNGSIAAGASCKVSVFFTPAVVGTTSGTLTISDASQNLLATVTLTGTGVAPTTLTPATLSFGNEAVNETSPAKTATLKNNQPTPLTISSIAVDGGNAPGDYAPGGTCPISPATLGAKKSCSITVTFTPSAQGSRTGTLTVTDDASTSPQTVSLSGTGVDPVTLSVSSLTFGTVYAGNTSAAKMVMLTNDQTKVLNFSSIATSGDYAISSNTCGNSIAAGASCKINVTFSPTGVGERDGTLTFTDDASNSPQTVSLSGSGALPVTISPASAKFASLTVGTTSAPFKITLTNHLGSAVSVSTIATTGDFAVSSNGCGNSVGAGQKCVIGVTFTPTEVGLRTGTLSVTYGAFGSPAVVPLQGTGNANGLKSISVTPTNPSIAAGSTLQFIATGQFANGSTENLTGSVTWGTSASTVASISATGLATGVGAGQTLITATLGTISGSTTLTVTPATYSIGGTISGLTGSGLVLQNNGGNNLAIAAGATSFTFTNPIPAGGTYNVTVLTQPSNPLQTCVVTNGSGTANANVTNVQVACTTITYTVGGAISGLSGSGLVLQNNGGNNLTVTAGATSFTFSNPIPAGTTYNVTVLTQPSNPLQTCLVTNGSGTANSNVTNIQVTCTNVTYTVGGAISGLTGSGLVLQDNGGNNLTVPAGATSFTFSNPIPAGSTYNVTVLTQPSNPTQTCAVTNGSGTANANVTNIQVTCTTVTYTIGGSISGLTGSGLVLQDNGGDNLAVAAGSTSFTFATPIAAGNAYNVTVLTQPANPAQTCVVTNASGTANGNVTTVQVTCATSYTIGGTISGLTGSGLVLQDNGGNNLTVAAGATSFTFSNPIPAGTTYNVTVLTQPSNPTQTCSVTNGTGTANSNVTNILVTCTSTTYTIGGTVSGLTGSGLVLQDNGGNNLTVPAGATTFTFSNPIPAGTTYNVTVFTQPSAQTCVVSNGSGTANANVTNVQVACTNTYTIGGTITGLTSSGLVLQNNGGDNLIVAAGATTFTFATPITAGSTYNVTELTQPSNPAQTCVVTNGTGTANANVTNVVVTCTTVTYTIGGTISGLVGSGLVLQNNGTNNLTVAAGATTFTFSKAIAAGSAYNVTVKKQPTSPAQTCVVTNGSGIANSNVTNVQVTCTTVTYTIGGTLSGLTGTGLVLQDNGGDNLTIPAGATAFTFATPLTAGSTYSVTVLTQPTSPAQTCVVTNGTGTANANVTNVVVTCTSTTYTIGGTISGLTGSGLVLQNNGGNNLTVAAGATFTFSNPIPAGTTYNVTVLTQPSNPTQTCVVTNGTGTANANVTSVQVTCTTVTYTIGGAVSGLTGTGLVLQNNGGNNLTVAAGATTFTFSTPIPAGTAYNVTVLTQPSTPLQTCVVTNGTGTANANVTNIQVTCTNVTYTIGGTISGLTGSGLVLQNNGGNNLTVAAGATTFTFSNPIPAGTTYNVTALTQPSNPAQTCVVTNGTGTANANVTNVQVTCTTSGYTIGGTISGLTGSGLVLQNNGGNNLTVAAGATTFTFTTQIPAGSTYNVTVLTQPSNPAQTCIVSNGTGTANSNVTNVQVTCATFTGTATLSPSSVHQGSSATVVITGTNTNFGPSTVVNFGADIATGTVSVNGPTSASVPIMIDNVAAIGQRTITIMTGTQGATATFTVVTGVPAVTVISPNTIQPTQTESVTITGAFTNWVSGTTKANFGPGIAVGGASAGQFGPVTVNSPTSATASLVTFGATKGFRAAQVQTGSQTLTVNNGILVGTCSAAAPTVLSISPFNGALSVPLNAQVQIQFSVPMNRSTFSLGNTGSATVFFYDAISNQEVPGTISLDASGTIASITSSEALPAGRSFVVYLSDANPIQDTCGNNLPSQQFSFATGFGDDLTGPSLTGTSPVNGDTNSPLNAQVVLQFNDQLDPITAQSGFSMTTGASTVAGTFSYSTNDQTVTFTPTAQLAASTTYTVNYSAQITDTVGNTLSNPGSFSFTTGTSTVSTGPVVTAVDPPSHSVGVGLNIKPHVIFSEPVNQLTIPSALSLSYENGGPAVPATVTVAANRMSATITPSAALLPNTEYGVKICGYSDIAGNTGYCLAGSTFFTGTSADTNNVTVSSIVPPNAQTGVPLNAQIVAVMSEPVDPTSITSTAITVTPSGGSAISGTVSLASDGVTLTFVPGAALTANKAYTVAVSGFVDVEGNSVTPFTSTFTAGTSTYGASSFKLSSTSPTNKSTGVAVNTPVTFTMSNLIDAASVNSQTVEVEICFDGTLCSVSEFVAGTFSVNGAAVTFTPLSPYPANTVIGMYVNGLLDEAGNTVTSPKFGTFTTANTVDQTAPTVTISPSNGTTNVGLNTQIVLTFSKSINASTLTGSSVAVFNGDIPVDVIGTVSISQDNRTITLNPGGKAWTPGAIVTVELSNAIQDLSGNALANTTSQFTLTTAAGSSAPSVVAMRPGNGATNVPANTAVTLFTSAAMNPSTIAGALFITDNGVPVTGTVQLFSNAQAIEFTPANTFNPGDLVQVFLNSTAQGANGIALSSFSGQFTVAGSPANTAASAQAVNPFPNATNVPLNTVIQVQFNQPLQTGTVTCNAGSGSVTLFQVSTSTYLTPNCTVVGNGQVINIAPSSNLASGSQYQVKVSASVTNTSGVPVQAFTSTFTAGSVVDNAAPTIVSEAPINNATGVGTNALVSVNFNKAINPVSVSGSTIQLSGGSVTEVPSSISFTPDYTRVTIVPQAPLPASTVMTLAVNGVTSQAGVSVATKTTTFTTAAQPDFVAPYVINSSVQNGQANVPVNSVFSLQFSKAMDIGSFSPSNVYVSGGIANAIVPSTISWSADQTTIFIVPSAALNVGDAYSLCSSSMTDLDGNPQQSFCANFTAAFAANSNGPTVINTSPENSASQVPTNTPVQILFNEPVQPTSIGQVTLKTGGNVVAVSAAFSDANQLLTLTPTLPLAASASYSIAITGVKDTAGNQMSGTTTNTFTTGPTFDLSAPSVLSSDPAPNTIAVGTNVAPRLVFSKRLNSLSVVSSSNETYNQGSVQLLNTTTGLFVPLTVSLSSDRTTATLTPTSPLTPSTQYEIYVGQTANYYDVAGNIGVSYTSYFTTDTGADNSPATVSTIVPSNNQTAVPLNAQIVAVMSDTIDPTTVTNSSITVTLSGGSAVAGTVTLASDGVTLTFVPNAALTKAKVYNVAVGGFNDVQSNPVTAFTSSFTTGSSTYGSSSFTLVSTNPTDGTGSVSVTSPITFTMSNLIDAASVNTQTVEVCFGGCGNRFVAGTYVVSGATVTFTPLTAYPANATIGMYVDGLMDEAGNITTAQDGGSFQVTGTIDHTPPTVTITPSNGASNIGLNTEVVLTFSKSINPTTVSSTTVNLFNGDVPLNPAMTISQDNRTVILNSTGANLPAGATLTVTASHLITDLSGNALADTISQFTTVAVQATAPSVLSSRPTNGATNVPANTIVTLFTSAPMNTGTIAGALYVSQNGVVVSGTTAVGSNGQSIVFTPNSNFTAGVPIQVFLNSTAQDIYGNSLTNFAETFTIAGALASSAAVAQVVNPFPNASNVPLNTVIQVEFNQPLQSGTITCNGGAGSVTLYQGSTGTYLTPNCTLTGGGQVINIAPTANLASGSTYKVLVSGSVTNTSGVPVQSFTYNFTAGSAVDNAAPTIASLSPPDSATNIGTNAGVSVNFNKAINPVSVSGSTIQLSGGSVTEVPSSISFTPDFTRTTIVPQAPLPSSTQMAVAINGVTSESGVAVASQTTHFTTMAGPDVISPYVVNSSVATNQFVGTNAAFAMQFDEAIDPGSLNPAGAKDVYIYDSTSAAYVATTNTFSADLTTVMLKPNANLAANHQFQMCSSSLTDLSGNPQQNFCVSFNSGSGTDTTGPVVLQASPPNGSTGVGINAWVQILFNEPIDPASLGGVVLKKGGTVIPTIVTTFDGDQGVQLLPLAPLSPNTTYLFAATGVLDITGNGQSGFVPQSFTTGSGIDLVTPTLVSTTPANGASGVAATTTVQAVFSKAMDPASFDPANSFTLVDSSRNTVPATISFSPDFTTATLTPKSNLTGGGATYYLFVSYFGTVYDQAGNRVAPSIISFSTQ